MVLSNRDLPQRKIAIVYQTAYKNIRTSASRKTASSGQPSGLSASAISAKQFDALVTLMQEFWRNFPERLAECREEKIKKVKSYQDGIERLCTIPGIDILTAWTLIAELL